jgi:hypothetical protein
MKAGNYGIKNLQRILEKLPEWAEEPGKDFATLRDLYSQISTQFGRYCNHVTNNIGGLEKTPKRYGQPGIVYQYTAKEKQKEAMQWLQQNLFKTPYWITNRKLPQ